MNLTLKLKLFLTFLLILTLTLKPIAQEQEGLKFYVGPEVSIDYGYRKITPISSDYNVDLKELRNKAEMPAIGYQYGLSSMAISKRGFLFKLGVLYSMKGYNSTGPFNNQGISSIDVSLKNFYYFNYISSHFQTNHIIQFADAHLFYGVGLNANYFRSAFHRTVTFYDDGTINDVILNDITRDFKTWHVEGTLQLGIFYPYNDFLTVKVYPIFRYGLAVINQSDAFLERLYSGGIHLSVYLNL